MTTVNEHIRNHLLSDRLDLEPIHHITFEEIDANRKKFELFIELMNNRMRQGYFRYGRNEENEPAKLKYFDHIIKCLQQYKNSGNQEYLVDAANTCRLEFMYPSAHKNPHFNPTDDGDHAEEL